MRTKFSKFTRSQKVLSSEHTCPSKVCQAVAIPQQALPQTHSVWSIYPHPSLSQGSNPKSYKPKCLHHFPRLNCHLSGSVDPTLKETHRPTCRAFPTTAQVGWNEPQGTMHTAAAIGIGNQAFWAEITLLHRGDGVEKKC